MNLKVYVSVKVVKAAASLVRLIVTLSEADLETLPFKYLRHQTFRRVRWYKQRLTASVVDLEMNFFKRFLV